MPYRTEGTQAEIALKKIQYRRSRQLGRPELWARLIRSLGSMGSERIKEIS